MEDPWLPYARIMAWFVKSLIASFIGSVLGYAIGVLLADPMEIEIRANLMLAGSVILVILSTVQDMHSWGWFDWSE